MFGDDGAEVEGGTPLRGSTAMPSWELVLQVIQQHCAKTAAGIGMIQPLTGVGQ